MKKLDMKQKIVNELYEKEGLTDKVLEMQVEINKQRAENNIPDPEELIYKNFAQ